MRFLFLALIRVYRACISPLLGPRCRFTPTCSEYAEEALKTHGALKGSLCALGRILRCHPFGSSGFDPVPQNNKACHCKGSAHE